jgi:hypothetical protein
MKRSPQKELRIVATWLLFVAGGLLVFVICEVPAYRAIFSQPWQKSFVREADFEFYRFAFRQFLFTLLPLIAGLQFLAAWKLLKTAKRLENAPANSALQATAASLGS